MIPLVKKIYSLIPRKERKVVLENFLSLSSLQSINYILPILVLPYLIRIVGPEKFGLIAFAQAFVQYFLILTDYGFSLTATRAIALCREKQDKVCAIFSSVMTVKIILAAASFFLLLAILHFIPRFRDEWLLFFFSFGAVIGNTLFPLWYFQGTERMKYIAGLNIISGIVSAALIFLLVCSPQDYLLIPLINSTVSVITGLIGLYIVLGKFGVFFIVQSYGDIRQQLKQGWSIFSSVVAINAYTATRIFAVGLLTNNTVTGYYSIAEKIAAIIQTFPLTALSQAIYPRLSKLYRRNKTRARELMRKIQNFTTLGFICCLPLAYGAAPVIISLVSGSAYPAAVQTFRLLLISILFIGANAFKVQYLLVCGRYDLYSRIHITMAIAGVPIIFFLIGGLSYTGAAVSTIIIEAAIFVLTAITLRYIS